jgi:hypothetical protein
MSKKKSLHPPAIKPAEFTASSVNDGLLDKFVVNWRGKFFQYANDRDDAKRQADILNRKNGMKTLYS